MTWVAVAKKDFSDAVQSKALWTLVIVFVGLSMITSYAFAEAPEVLGEADVTFEGLLFFTTALLALFVPLAAIVVCYKSVAGERELGSVKLLLSLPTTRRSVFAGKVVGRGLVLTVGLGIGLLVGLGFGAILLGEVLVGHLVGFVLVTLGFIAVYGTIMVGLSATTGSTTRATTLALGFFVVLELLWEAVLLGVLYVAGGFSMPTQIPDWFMTLAQLSPSTAYVSGVVAVLPEAAEEADVEGVDAGPMGEMAFETPELGLVILAGWFLLAVVVGSVQFSRADL